MCAEEFFPMVAPMTLTLVHGGNDFPASADRQTLSITPTMSRRTRRNALGDDAGSAQHRSSWPYRGPLNRTSLHAKPAEHAYTTGYDTVLSSAGTTVPAANASPSVANRGDTAN